MRRFLTFIFFKTFIFLTLYGQNTVYINVPNGNEGRGILKSRGNECFIITPHHVVKDALEDINVIGEKKVKSTASIEQQYASVDLSILRVEKGGMQKCTDWTVAPDFEKIIDNNSNGFVEYRDSDGSTQKAEVEIIGVNGEEIQIQRKDPMTVFVKGWSGSSFFINQNGVRIYMGMLYQIQGRAGYVMRADHMFNIMTNFFGKEEKQVEGLVGDNLVSNDLKRTSGVLRELETKQVKLAITKFEQNNNKAIFHYTLTNTNPAQQIVEFNSQLGYLNLIDQSGYSYSATNLKMGIGNNSNIELIYNVPVSCTVEFEVGANKITKAAKLQLNGWGYEFKFINISILSNNELPNNSSANLNKSLNKSLGIQSTKLINLNVVGFEQNNNKAIFHYTLTNTNPAKQIVEFNSQLGYLNLIDQSGYSYSATNLKMGIGNNSNIELIYNVPVSCTVEFEVGANKITKAAKLQLSGWGYEFIFINLNLFSDLNFKGNANNPSLKLTSKGLNIGSMNLNNISILVSRIEKIGTKLIFHYSYENLDKSKQIVQVSTSNNYNILKIAGSEFHAKYVSIGSSGNNAELIYQVPVPCFVEFDIGALQPTKIESLKLGLYNYDFEFVGSGPIGTEKSLKSLKSIQARNELIGAGVKLGFDLLTKKKN
jgi:hypothetical protein